MIFANDSELFSALGLTRQDHLIAIENLQFLFPTTGTSTLLNNSKFIDTLVCSQNSQNASCLDVCGNVEDVFANWPNFYTCSWFPSISEALDTMNYSIPQMNSLASLGIKADQKSFSYNVSATMTKCLADYCNTSPGCHALDSSRACSYQNLLVGADFRMLNRSGAIDCLQNSICDSTSTVNPDIGGLGVLLALVFQDSISLLAIILHITFYLRYKLSHKLTLRKRGNEKFNKHICDAKTGFNTHLETLTSAIVEFQKAQCFFATTIQVASLIVLPSYIDASDSRNSSLLRLTAANAFTPVTLTLAHIDFISGRKSIFLLILSSITFMCGTATYWLAKPFKAGSAVALSYTSPKVPVLSCNNIAPFTPCFVGNEFYVWGLWAKDGALFNYLPEKIGLAIWIISLGTLCSKIFCAIGRREMVKQKSTSLKERGFARLHELGTALSRVKMIQKVLIHWERFPLAPVLNRICFSMLNTLFKERVWIYIQLSLGTITVLLQLISVSQVFGLSSIIVHEMSFGQIVAVGIWIPVLIEYAYLVISKSHILVPESKQLTDRKMVPKKERSTGSNLHS